VGNEGSDASKRFDACFQVGRAFAARGLDIGLLSVTELSELEDLISTRLAPVFDEIVERWQEEHGMLSGQELIDRELRQRINADRDRFARDDYECEGCSFHHYDHCAFVDFHGLSLCDGCADRARRELYDIQRPLIEALAAEPTLERAGALGFELTRDEGRLVWIGEDDDYDGGKQPYADEREALEMLAEELTSYL
jgi:hypothetical protein